MGQVSLPGPDMSHLQSVQDWCNGHYDYVGFWNRMAVTLKMYLTLLPVFKFGKLTSHQQATEDKAISFAASTLIIDTYSLTILLPAHRDGIVRSSSARASILSKIVTVKCISCPISCCSPSQPITTWWEFEQTKHYGSVKPSSHLQEFAVAFLGQTQHLQTPDRPEHWAVAFSPLVARVQLLPPFSNPDSNN